MKSVIFRYKNGTLSEKELEAARNVIEKLLFGEGLLVIDNKWEVTVLDKKEESEENE